MDIEKKKLSEDSTIYQYKLIKRIPVRYEYLVIYLSCLLIVSFILIYLHNLTEVVSLLLGYVFIQILHTAIISVDFLVRSKVSLQKWTFQLTFPWIGFMPKQPISVQAFTTVQLRLLFIGIAFIACFFPWASILFLSNLLFLHLWILLPRFVAILLVHVPKTGLIKLEQKSISHYSS